MRHLLPRLDATRLLIAVKTCLAIVLALAITFRLDWKPSFMAILILVLQTDALGATYKKGLLYIVGTLCGAIAGVAMIALFAHDRRLFILGMAVLTGFGLYHLQGSRYPYAWLISIVTLALAGWLPSQSPSQAFELAVMRASTICVGVVLAFFVHGVLWPIRGGATFERQQRDFLEGCRSLLSLTRRQLAGDEPDSDAARRGETGQIKAIAALRSSLDAAAQDTESFRRFRAGYEDLVDALRDLLLAILALRDLTSSLGGGADTPPVSGFDNLVSRLERVERQLDGLVRDGPRRHVDMAVDRDSESITGPDRGDRSTMDTALGTTLEGRINDVVSQVANVSATVCRLETPREASAPPPPPRARFSLTSARFQKAAAGSLMIVLITSFFIVTQWPRGLSLSMIFVTLSLEFTVMIPLAMIGRPMLLSLAVSPAIAGPLYLGIMPRVSQFEQLIPWLVVVFVPLLYVQTSRNPRTMFVALFSSIFLIVMLSLDERHQAYSFSSFVTNWLGLCGGFGIPVAALGLFSTVVPEREFRKQVRSFFAGSGQLMRDLAQSLPGSAAGAAIARTGTTRLVSVLRQLQMWSSAIDYRRVPGNDQQKARALIESIEVAALRIGSAEHARRKPISDPLREPLGRLYDACIESFQVIARSLGDLRPVPALPETRSLLRDIESKGAQLRLAAAGDDDRTASAQRAISAGTGLHLLADALDDCRDKANAIDWKAWNRNHF